jgi:hypothetical protein
MTRKINLSLQKFTLCENRAKILDPRWFGPRIYPGILSLECWPLSLRIKILKYIFSLVFVKKIHANQTNGFKDNCDQTHYRQRDRQTTGRQTDRQTDIFELTLIYIGNFNFFLFFAYGLQKMNVVKFIPPCSGRRGIINNWPYNSSLCFTCMTNDILRK